MATSWPPPPESCGSGRPTEAVEPGGSSRLFTPLSGFSVGDASQGTRAQVTPTTYAAYRLDLGGVRGLDDPTRTIRLDVTPMGFHASVRRPGGDRAWYVDPAYEQPGTTTHNRGGPGRLDRSRAGSGPVTVRSLSRRPVRIEGIGLL